MTTSVPMRVPLGGDPSMVEPGNNEGDWIRSLRRKFKLSQVEFAALLGVSNVTVNRWERGHVRPQPTMRAYLRQLENHKSPIEMVESATTEIRGNLPERRDGFIGRAVEMTAAADLVSANRIVTILGSGGSGKTRLAIEVSHLVGHRFPDGVWFIDLAPVSQAGLIADAVARTLGVPTGSP